MQRNTIQAWGYLLICVDADFLWHGIEMLVSQEPPKHTLVLHAGLLCYFILVMAPDKWDMKWVHIKTSIGILVFGSSLTIYLICASIH